MLVTLLALSALLNFFFVAGALWSHLHARPTWSSPQDRYRQIAAALDLNPQQRIGFDRYVAAMRTRSEKMREQIRPLIGNTWDEMAKPDADIGKITGRFDEASEKWRQFQHEATAQTLDFLATLSPAQRAKFVATARERRAPWLRSHGGKH